ncbi:MAG TPA: CRISPR-associated endonuclease Cas2 [Niabella sp.]|nr:CRISPR-associated endonuclease Cas2 [Niabella sp.]HQW15135.1 CRISPR-associated endonuclease Cas2 [Niabella sp.]HQX20276.1 CRISPR-associated endonuclease Cas2 [Niabella sp.]HRB07397.1 CRISPR-associated endonuclease Cas2 [Niabella sp.]HRB35589.1 CRISPR-associated endonuclease Cas2 [Niabella sp.]
MLLVSYDISDDKLRTRFSKYLSKFGYRLQYSLFQIKNSDRILQNIQVKIENYFGKRFQQTDSVIVFELTKSCKITKYGYAKNDDEDLIII